MSYPRRSLTWAVSLSAVLLLTVVLAPVRSDDKPSPSPQRAFKPLQQLDTLMEAQDLLFRNVRTAIIEARWDDAVTQAWILAELGNVNSFVRSETDYVRHATNMSSASVELAKVLKQRDAVEAKKAANLLGERCKACHDQYKKD